MKFNHKFMLSKSTDSFREYMCDDATARIDFISDSAIRVAIYKDENELLPSFNVSPDTSMWPMGRKRLDTNGFALSSPSVSVNEDKEFFELKCGVNIQLDLNNFLLKYDVDGKELFCDRQPLAYNIQGEFGNGSYHYISRCDNERIFGLGDKGGELNKAGRSFRIETTDCMGYDASQSDPLYKHIPFYICENNVSSYGIFYDTADNCYFDLGKEINNYYQPYKYFKTEDNCLVYYVFFGTKLSVLKQFSRLCGKQAFPPRWSFDYCASTMAYTDAPDAENQMNMFLKKIKELDLNCSGFYLSSGYTSIGNQRCVFNWNNEKFPNPKAFIERFSSNKIEIIPNIKPAFLESHPMYNELKDRGLFVKNSDGTPFVTQFWDGLGSYLDFTNQEAFDFWKKQVTEKLLDYGIVCTWNDNNEFDIKDSEAVATGFGKEISAGRIKPVLTYLMNLASYQAQLTKNPALRPMLSTRSGNIGVRRIAQTWSGDNRTEFKDLRYCHYIGLTMSMSGLYFYGHDLGGFSGDMPSRELLLRWLQLGLFQPRFTIHSWNKDGSATMPWSYEDIIPSVKEIFAQRKSLIPYLYNCAYRAVEYDEPINSPLFLYYDDESISLSSNSFLLGRDILVTCIFDEGEENVDAYLPKGDCWYLDDMLYSGGQFVKLNIPAKSKMPYFVRGGCVLPTDNGNSGFNGEERLTLTVYPIKDGEFYSSFFWDDGKSFEYKNNNCAKLNIRAVCNEKSVTVEIENMGDMEIHPDILLCKADGRRLIVKD